MDIKEFVNKFNEYKDKENLVKKHIVNNYIPYARKMAVCTNIVKSSCYVNVDQISVFKMNTPIKSMLLSLTFIQEYTDLELSKNPMEDFDLLSEYMALGAIIKCIPESEVLQLTSILDVMISDEITNTRDLVGYIDSKINSLGLFLNDMVDVISQNPEIMAKIKNITNK